MSDETGSAVAGAELPPDLVQDPPGVRLDSITRERITVAAVAADTLEALAGEVQWTKVDRTVARHLEAQSRRLCRFLERVQELDLMQEAEAELLSLRRSQRRLEISLELLDELGKDVEAPKETHAERQQEFFLGDFTHATISESRREAIRTRKAEAKAEKEARRVRAKRIALHVAAACLAVVGAGLLTSFLDGVRPAPGSRPGPYVTVVPNEHLDDIKIFLPARRSFVSKGVAQVVVSRDWLATPPSTRVEEAEAVHVFLANRGVPQLMLVWEGGGLIATGGRDESMLFRDSQQPGSSRRSRP